MYAHVSLPYKNFFSNKIVNITTFTSSIISMITIILVIYLYCKHKHIRTIIASLILHKIKEVEADTATNPENTECLTLAYIGITLTVLSMMIVVLLHYRRSKFCRGYRFSNVVKIVLFISDVQHYIPVKLTKTSGSAHLFKFTGTLNSEDIKLNKNYLWDTLEINWDKIKLTFNDSEIKLPQLVTIKMQDKIRMRRMMSKDPQNSHVMIKECSFLHGFFRCKLPMEVVDMEVKVTSMQGTHIFKRDRTTQLTKCIPWTTKIHPHPNIIKKMKTFLEVENKMGLSIPMPTPNSQFRPLLLETNPNIHRTDKVEKRKTVSPKRKFKPVIPRVTMTCLPLPQVPPKSSNEVPPTVRADTPWPGAGKMSGNLFEDRNWLLPKGYLAIENKKMTLTLPP